MVALYIRLSRADDTGEKRLESNSIKNQRRLLRDFLSELPDLREKDSEEFIDDGYSGTNFQRPAFQRMLSLVKRQVVTTVIVKDFSRFGRNYVECSDYVEKLFPFLGTRFISISDNYDSGSCQESGIDLAMKNIVNSYYSKDLSRKVTSTFDLKRENGEFFFAVPFGYLKDENRPGKVIIDDKAAEVVRHIFSLACEGLSTGMIAKRLNRENVPTVAAYNRDHRVKGKSGALENREFAAWNGTKVGQILKNEVYAGTFVLQKRRLVSTGSKKSEPIECPKKIPDNHPAIVDLETFSEAQKIFRRIQRKPSETRRYPLKSKVFCGNCGYAMTYQENVYAECYFFCSHSAQTGLSSGCPSERFSEELLNERVFPRLRQWMMLLETACGAAEEAERMRQQGLNLLSTEAETLQSAIDSLKSQKLALYESYADGQLSKDDYIAEKASATSEISSIQSELMRLHEKEQELRYTRNRRKPELDSLLESVHLFASEPHLTRKMSETFITRITIYDKWQMDITWNGEDLITPDEKS